jgi:hypothetical protein
MSKSRCKGTSYGTQIKKRVSTYIELIKKAKGLGTSMLCVKSEDPSRSHRAARG